MHIKFCGFTRQADVQAALALGIDAIGLVFYPPSPRAITAKAATDLIQSVPAFVTITALVVNMPQDELTALATKVMFDVIQFHGDETPADCQRLAGAVNKRWIKALRVDAKRQTQQDVANMVNEYTQAGASSVLLDAYHKHAYGGTGERFDWVLIPNDTMLSKLATLILAGGLTPDNVGEAVAQIRANNLPVTALDVSGGIESAKGIKETNKMKSFLAQAKNIKTANHVI